MFAKKAKTIQEHIEKLQERGLQISKPHIAEKYLQNISYYRLGEYWYVMQSDKENHIKFQKQKEKKKCENYGLTSTVNLILKLLMVCWFVFMKIFLTTVFMKVPTEKKKTSQFYL